MKTLVTGAGGFLGRAVVDAVDAAGHEVLAMVRPASSLGKSGFPGGQVLAGDLRQRGEWVEALAGIEAVVHCAAAASGDLATQLAGTVLATENLLASLPRSVKCFVHISSFSVYDFGAPSWHGKLDETTPMERRPLRRDAYTQTKLQQEEMVREHCHTHGIALTVIRPGAIYGPGKEWDHGRAMKLGRFDLIFAPLSRMRLVHVEDCASAIAAALTRAGESELIVNVVGDAQPTHWGFHRRARKAGANAGTGLPVPYFVVRLLGLAAWTASRLFFGGRARLPEWLDLPRQEARWRPLRYGNSKAKQVLGWQEQVALDAGIIGMLPNAPQPPGELPSAAALSRDNP